ncbi:peptidoglycan-N-acetylglucosamine deacetylase [Paenibacillus sp. BIHB 4019]|uniref:Peptidoglycan-N-acetylglucosamine deacetylase n=1 Tax=Paenibacillus sp. BIHB 4019 TaxID=1870819 RepID=A0A1B2DSW3_9BACL|nr:peptidoglycan-N-acetylglucosamine deacetylase [Paenibacillus sp. BIHB 4019]
MNPGNKPRLSRKRKLRYRRISIVVIVLASMIFGIIYLLFSCATDEIRGDLYPISKKQPSMQSLNIHSSRTPDEVPVSHKVVYLTFDDGPSKYTNEILDILKEYQARATFFMIGAQLDGHKNEVQRMVIEGSYPGLHSMSHDFNILYKSGSSTPFIEEFQREQQLVEDIVGFAPNLIRAPYGSEPQIDEEFRGDISASGFRMWDWTVDSMDWSFAGEPDKIVELVRNNVHRDREVILMHERKQTLEALPRILKFLQEAGYEFNVYDPNNPFIANFSGDSRL